METMYQKIVHAIDPILLIGLIISITISIVMVLTGIDTLSGLIVGLLSTTITLTVDAITRIHKAEQSFLDAAELTRVLTSESIGTAVREIFTNYEKIAEYNFEHYDNMAEAAIDECLIKLREIASGSALVTSETFHRYGILGMEQVETDVKVIHIDSMEFWDSDFGKKYWRRNLAAMKHGVNITRIFALTSEELRNSREQLKEQEESGVRVFVIDPNRIKNEFTIFDNKILVNFEASPDRELRSQRIILEPTLVKNQREEFNQLLIRYAKPLAEALSEL